MRGSKTPLKEEIIDKSIQLFLRKGYNATRVEDITDASNVSKAAFYCHFASKSELLETIVDRYGTLFVDSIVDAVRNSKGDFLRKFRYSHKWATDFAYNNTELCVGFTTIAAEMTGSGTPIEAKIKAIRAKYRSFIKEMLDLGKKEGKLRDDLNIDLTAHAMNAIHDGSLIEWYSNSDHVDGVQFALTYLEITLKGILK
jgi:AcrR family transcriptional regulator